jgi:hypothetical protein
LRVTSRGLGDVYKRQSQYRMKIEWFWIEKVQIRSRVSENR